ncbi:MAG: hypothetical protein ABIA93_00675 [Candidatus Woesearchaeota archaeon]
MFHFKNGRSAKNLEDFLAILPEIPEEEFKGYVSKEHNNFADWFEHSLHQKELAARVRGRLNRADIINEVRRAMPQERIEPMLPRHEIKKAVEASVTHEKHTMGDHHVLREFVYGMLIGLVVGIIVGVLLAWI